MEHRRAGADKAPPGEQIVARGCATGSLPGALLHHGQGKWYPGEPLPRWAFGATGDATAFPSGTTPDSTPTRKADDYGHGPDDAFQFAHELAERLGVSPKFCQPGYEDVYYYLWREQQLARRTSIPATTSGRPRGARTARPALRAWLGPGRRLSHCRSDATNNRPPAASGRAEPGTCVGNTVPGPWRFADGLPLAA